LSSDHIQTQFELQFRCDLSSSVTQVNHTTTSPNRNDHLQQEIEDKRSTWVRIEVRLLLFISFF
jgi:hypothetical protein